MIRATKRLLLVLAAIGALLALPAGAQGEISPFFNFGGSGSGGGKLSNPASLAINNSNGNLYVVDRGNNRIQQLTTNGTFIRTWGYDVVSTGEDNKPFADEVEEVRIRATGGSFALTFEGAETPQLPYNATNAEVQTALNGLSTISEGGGSVTVTGGPGDVTGANPYVVTFNGGPLAQTNLDLGIEPSGLGIPAGTELSCEGGPTEGVSFGEAAPALAYQWLANGEPVPGATGPTFTPGPGEEGKAIQCRTTATFGVAKSMATSRPYSLASPVHAMLPPVGPASLAAPEGIAVLESAGGAPLTCNAGTWTRNPETFTYRWYRNGKEIGSPTTTTETSNQYVLTIADLATRAVFQCGVTGNNSGGSSTTISGFLPTDPKPINPETRAATAAVSINSSGRSKIITRTNGGPVFEICKVNPPSTDVCKAGATGNGAGQLWSPRSIAIDNSAGGDGAVYVMDDLNPRVQKFSAEGALLMSIGMGVNQTTDGDVCTVASGDACGQGIRATDLTPGAFGGAPFQIGDFVDLGNQLAVDPDGNVYVGDPRFPNDFSQPRIQKFGASGAFVSQASVPYVFANPSAPVRPISIAVDSTQRVYAATPGEFAAVERFSPSEFSLDGKSATRPGNLLHELDPMQLAIDPNTDRVLVSDRNESEDLPACGSPALPGRAIAEYDSQGHQLDCTVPTESGFLSQVTGMSVSKTGRLYASVGPENMIKVFKLPTSTMPAVGAQVATNITTESAEVHGQINPGFEDTTYSVEYGPEDCEVGPCQTVAGGTLYGLKFTEGLVSIKGLQPNTRYHYRVVAENVKGALAGSDRTFTTFPFVDLVNDPCSNALARKQTKTAGLLDCRAYELASAAFSGGYDVVSNLIPGQSPFDAHPGAGDKILYGVKDGGIPGTGKPTNRGIDPYVATRGDSGWSTKYVGIPSDNPFATEPFSSAVIGADEQLDTFVFGGPEICDPCFADGSSGTPVHLPSGDLVQGMTGSDPDTAATPAGYVAKALSADGSHLLFGTAAKLEPSANEGGDPTIYARDLAAGTTQVVSTLPNGDTMSGEVGALDISTNGSRILVGEELGTDAKGNFLWHPYLHIGASPNSVDLAEATTTGVLFNGMTADGSTVFFTTIDELLPAEDTDESADIYRATVDQNGNLDLSLVSVNSDGSPSNDDSCTPAGTPASWNAAAGNGKCGALAFAGGAGMASGDGSVYFLSPEQLAGSEGTLNQPNLYLAEPGSAPRFVATIELDNPAILNATDQSETHTYGDFQVTPDGGYAAFATTMPLKAGYDNAGHYELYRYDAGGDALDCVSCSPTESQAESDSGLPPNGLGLVGDGRVFFNSGEQLTLRDTNGKLDAYEWKAGAQQLISTGNSAHPSGLLGVSSDGKDAFFFTREVLVPDDRNGLAMKIYDAREQGGVFVIPPPPPCAASDECHGPGTKVAPPPQVGTFKGTGGQASEEKPKPKKCPKGKVKRKGKCVKKPKHSKHKKHSKNKKGASR